MCYLKRFRETRLVIMIVTARGTFNPHCEVWTVILSAGISATKQGREFPPTMEIDSIINVAENRAEFRE